MHNGGFFQYQPIYAALITKSLSEIGSVKLVHDDEASWSRFVEVYAPLVYGYLRKRGLQDADAADLTQDTLENVAKAIKHFDYDPQKGSFRGWLFTITRNRLLRFLDQQQRQVTGTGDTLAHQNLQQQPNPNSDPQSDWDRDYQKRLFQWAADAVRGHFQNSTWNAFWQTAVEGKPAADVAQSLDLTPAAVYMAKRRVMKKIQQHIAILQGNIE